MPQSTVQQRELLVRRGRRLEYFTICWNSLEAVAAAATGIIAGSVALVGFGLDSFIEVMSAAALLWRLHHDTDDLRREHVERLTLRVVSACFLLLALYITFQSGSSLLKREPPERSAPGIIIAAASLVTMPLLSPGSKPPLYCTRMKALAYVSDEMYRALPDAAAEFHAEETGDITLLRSSPQGAFYGDLKPGRYRVTLSKAGYGSKTSDVVISGDAPIHFRLLRDRLLGYMWPKWVRSGEPAEYRVHGTEQYQLTLWRYGLKKEFVRMIGWVDEHGPDSNRQLLPDGDFTRTGVKWNEHGFAARPTIVAPDRTGLYYLWARTPSGEAFSFPWVVAPRRPQANIAVLASTNTWNAYNNFGGRSNYINPEGLPPRPVVNSRQDLDRFRDPKPFGVWRWKDEQFQPLSFDRPEPHNHLLDDAAVTDPVRGRVQCGQAPGEWRLLGWLEREGFDYDFYAEAQLHDGTLDLNGYRVLMLAIHPEYWTREMYIAVKRWVFERGGRLMYLAGNGLNCEVTLSSDGIMRCLSHVNSLHGELGGHSDDGTVEYESRMHRTLESEANLLGVVCTSAGLMTAAPYRVECDSHWIFAGTGLRNGDLFGEKTLHERVPGGASGHETDKRSTSSPANAVLLAKGTNADNGGAEVVYHETAVGGAVFSTGSITWIPALFPDAHVSRITRNVLSRFLADLNK